MDLFISSPKYKLTPIVRKMLVMSEVIKFFIHNKFVFANENLFDLIKRYLIMNLIQQKTYVRWQNNVIFRMTEYDRKYFICDPRVVNWKDYYIIYGLGARKHLLRDSFDNYEQARIRMKRLKWLHYCIKYACIAIILWIFYSIFVKALLNRTN